MQLDTASERKQVVAVTAAGEHVTFEHPLEERPTGSGRRRRADLFVVVEHDHRDRVVWIGLHDRFHAAQHDSRLSSRPLASIDRSPPITAAG